MRASTQLEDLVQVIMMDASTWIDRTADCLADLGDAELQDRAWLEGEGDEVSSFTEAFYALSDFDLPGFIERCEGWGYESDLAVALSDYWADLRTFVDGFVGMPSPEVVLAHPAWDSLRSRARVLSERVRAGKPRR